MDIESLLRRPLSKCRLVTHGVNEELCKHRRREGTTECSLCGDECEKESSMQLACHLPCRSTG